MIELGSDRLGMFHFMINRTADNLRFTGTAQARQPLEDCFLPTVDINLFTYHIRHPAPPFRVTKCQLYIILYINHNPIP